MYTRQLKASRDSTRRYKDPIRQDDTKIRLLQYHDFDFIVQIQ